MLAKQQGGSRWQANLFLQIRQASQSQIIKQTAVCSHFASECTESWESSCVSISKFPEIIVLADQTSPTFLVLHIGVQGRITLAVLAPTKNIKLQGHYDTLHNVRV